MAKRSAFLLVGPAVPGLDALHGLLHDDPALAAAGVALPAIDQALMDRADVELRRRHREVGVRRKDVEGSWAKVCRSAFKGGRDVLICQPGLVAATPEQVALAADGLVGMRLHLVLTPETAPDEARLTDLAAPWTTYVRRPSRVHVLPVGESTTVAELGAGLARVVLHARATEAERRPVTLSRPHLSIRDRLTRLGAA